jgi:hypothetical protein
MSLEKPKELEVSIDIVRRAQPCAGNRWPHRRSDRAAVAIEMPSPPVEMSAQDLQCNLPGIGDSESLKG